MNEQTNTGSNDWLDEAFSKIFLRKAGDWSPSVREAKQAIQSKVDEMVRLARVDEVKKIWGHAREHTIADIEMIQHHSNGQIDFIEAVDTKHLESRLAQLSTNNREKDQKTF